MLCTGRTLRIHLATVVLLAGCSGDPHVSEVLTTDSAGVTLVQHAGSIWDGPAQQWHAPPPPFLQIGSAEGAAPYLFDRVTGIAAVQDTLIVVADGGSNTLRWYDGAGIFLFERGGSGQGPGEFVGLEAITLGRGDTLVSTDRRQQRVTLHTSSGELVTSYGLRLFNRVPNTVHRLRDGSLITGAADVGSADLNPATLGLGIHRALAPVVRLSGGASAIDTVGVFPGMDIHVRSDGGRLSLGFPPFAKQLHYTADLDAIYVGTAEQFRIDRYSPTGQLQLSIRAPDVDLRLSPEEIAGYEEWASEEIRGLPEAERALQERYLEGLIYPAIRPAYSSLFADAEGNLWVGEYLPPPDQGAPRRWIVFAQTGHVLARITFPASFEPMSIVGGTVLGRAEDGMGVEYIHGYRVPLE